jgi:hypothetical protein
MTRPRHVIDTIFPISLFFVFAASALTVLLLSVNIYRDLAAAAEDHADSRTAFAYVLEKVRQNDTGDIQLVELEDCTCIALTQTSGSFPVTTYIYAQDGMLRELRVRAGASFTLADGSDLVPVQDFSPEQVEPGLYRLTLQAQDGAVFRLYLGERSEPS